MEASKIYIDEIQQLYKAGDYQEIINAIKQMGADKMAMTEPSLIYGTPKQGIDYESVFQPLKRQYPNLEEITVHDKAGYDAWIFRLKFDGIYYEAHIPRDKLAAAGNVSREVTYWLGKFIEENIKGVAKPAKKKRNVISKQQRVLKKEWLL